MFILLEVEFTISDETPWFGCLRKNFRNRRIVLETADLTVRESTPTTFQNKNECPKPVAKYADRPTLSRPQTPPPSPPTLQQITALLQQFDDSLYAHDFTTALTHVSCLHLPHINKPETIWGHCAISELVASGHVTHGETRDKDGEPWMQGRLKNFNEFSQVIADEKDPTLFHVLFSDWFPNSLSCFIIFGLFMNRSSFFPTQARACAGLSFVSS